MSRPLNSHLDFAPLRFSTCGLPERERLARWREEFGRSLLRVDIEPLSGRPFRPQATLRLLPELRTIEATGSAAHFRRAGALAVDPDDFISVIIGEHGIASQRGREAVLSAGDAIAVLHQEPGDITFPEGSFFAVLAPRTALASRVSDIEDAAMRPIPRGTEPLRLLVSYIRAVRNLTLASSEMRRLAVNHVHDLMAMALSSDRATSERGSSALAAAQLAAILEQIATQFQEPELSVAAVAKSRAISPRYLHRLLETSGMSFTERVNELRLQRAFSLLAETRGTERRISDIALDAGFSDISHFNRLFRSRFGDTPRGVRAQRKHRE
jgi:AraC-like DNA-binding protein